LEGIIFILFVLFFDPTGKCFIKYLCASRMFTLTCVPLLLHVLHEECVLYWQHNFHMVAHILPEVMMIVPLENYKEMVTIFGKSMATGKSMREMAMIILGFDDSHKAFYFAYLAIPYSPIDISDKMKKAHMLNKGSDKQWIKNQAKTDPNKTIETHAE
ncbi:hypothetical protein ACJX0J_012360, partial [Zea mays]